MMTLTEYMFRRYAKKIKQFIERHPPETLTEHQRYKLWKLEYMMNQFR